MSKNAIKHFIGLKVYQAERDFGGHGELNGNFRHVKLMAVFDGFAMVRRPRLAPYVCKASDLKPYLDDE